MAALGAYFQPQFTKLASGVVVPNAAGKVYTYAAGSTTPKTVYKDAAGVVPHTNPIILDADGFPPGGAIFFGTGLYDIDARDSSDASVHYFYNVVAPAQADDLSTLKADLADHTVGTKGAGLIGFDSSLTYAANTVGNTLQNLTYAEDYADLQDAFTAAKANNAPLVLAKKTYVCTTPLTDCEVTIYGNGAVIDMSGMGASDYGLTAAGTVDTTQTVAANIAANATSFTVSSATGITAGCWAYLRSSDVWSATESATVGEFIRVLSVVGTTITVYNPIRYAYTTANAAAVDVLTMAGGFSWNDFTILGSGAGSQNGCLLVRCLDVAINKVSTVLCNSRGIAIDRCFAVNVRGGTFERANAAGVSYGIVIYNGASSISVEDVTGYDLRHTISAGGTSGVCRGLTYSNSRAFGARDSGFDCHSATDGVTMRGLYVEGAAAGVDGISIQGVNFTVDDIDLRGIQRNGILAQNLSVAAGTATINDVQGDAAQVLVYVEAFEGNLTAVTISDVKGTGGTAMVYLKSNTGKSLLNGTVTGIRATATQARGIRFQSNGGTISGFHFSNIKLATATFEGFYVDNTSGTISDIRVESTTLSGGNYNFRCIGSPSAITIADASKFTGASVKPIDWATATGCKLERQIGTVTLAAGTAAVVFPADMPAATYRLALSSGANETMRWSAKATTGFTVTSSSGASTTAVDYIALM